MTKVIAIANQKGGVGKTHISLHLAGTLVELGKKVLLIDMDPQGNLSSIFIDNIYAVELSVAELLLNGNVPASEAIQTTSIDNLHILPSNLRLADIDAQLGSDPDSQYLLADLLESLGRDKYDFVFIDCPRSLGKATRMAMVSANSVLVPIQPQEWAITGLQQLLSFMQRIQKRANPGLHVLGLVVNLLKPRATEKNYLAQLRETYGDKVFTTELRDYVKYVDAVENKKPINLFAPRSTEADTYRQLAKEIIKACNE